MPIDNPSPPGKAVATGTYTGDGTDDRQITVGFECGCVLVFGIASNYDAVIMPGQTTRPSTGNPLVGGTTLHGDDGFIVFHTADGMNHGVPARVYYYWAIEA